MIVKGEKVRKMTNQEIKSVNTDIHVDLKRAPTEVGTIYYGYFSTGAPVILQALEHFVQIGVGRIGDNIFKDGKFDTQSLIRVLWIYRAVNPLLPKEVTEIQAAAMVQACYNSYVTKSAQGIGEYIAVLDVLTISAYEFLKKIGKESIPDQYHKDYEVLMADMATTYLEIDGSPGKVMKAVLDEFEANTDLDDEFA